MYIKLKRFFDIILSAFILLLLSPIFILLYLNVQRNPFFLQVRAGLGGLPFKVIKFKTMSDEVDDLGNLLPDFQRLTKLGKFIRKYSIDELPQLINVLKGDMSLIGPRPFLYEYMDIYSVDELRRHDVRPGISGWAQVNGRNNLSWKKKFKLDLYYVENVSFLLDLKIIILTLCKILNKNDIDQSENNTMEKYNGKN